jgi:tetratricopeptide (TPR) repeat protein
MKSGNRQSLFMRAGLIIVCLSLGLAAAWLTKYERKPQALVGGQTGAQTAGEILDSIPRPAGDSPTEKAIASGLERARRSPNDSKTWSDLGDALAQRVRDSSDQSCFGHAELSYGRALALDPRNLKAVTGLAWVYGGRHLFDQSVDWARKALEIDPQEPIAFGIIGDAELERGEYDQALAHYQKMMDLRPDLSSYSRGGYLLWLTGHRSKGILLMERAVRAGASFAENSAWCRAKLAMMLFDDGGLIPAWQILEPALATAPRNIHVLLAAGRIMTARHDYSAAIEFYEKALATAPNIEALAAIGDLQALQGETAKAEETYEQVEALHLANLSTGLHDHMQMARYYADHDRNLVEALRLAEQNKLTRNILQADTLAWVYFKHGDQAKAVEAINRALSQGNLDPTTFFHAGMIALRNGDRAAARRYLSSALSFNPEFNPMDAPRARETLKELEHRIASAPISGGSR